MAKRGRQHRQKPAPPTGTAVIYARFSCSKQREASIEDQLRVCTEWCAGHGLAVVATYSDYAVSGRTDRRPEFQRMIANAGEAEHVVVYMMDRFSRDVYDAPIYKKKLRDMGVKVVSATEAMPDGPEAILIESIFEAMAAMESAHISQRVRRGMEGKALQCLANGDMLYGYRVGEDGHYEIDEEQAPIVREVFRRRASGEPIHSIADDLARRGVRTSTEGPASYGFVYNMLKREKYTGTYIWGDVRVEGGMPAIVTKEEFGMARDARVVKDRATEVWGDYVLVGRAMCGGCGMGLVGVSGRGRGGKKYDYYRCSKRCGCKPVRADWLEGAIVEALRAVLSDREEALRIGRVLEEEAHDGQAEAREDAARRRRADAERGISRMMDAIAEGLDPTLATGKVRELQAQIEAADAELAVISRLPRFDAESFADFLQCSEAMDDETLLRGLVWQVWVGEDDVIATLSYDRNEKPARLRLSRVRKDFTWWAIRKSSRNVALAYDSGLLYMRFDRAA